MQIHVHNSCAQHRTVVIFSSPNPRQRYMYISAQMRCIGGEWVHRQVASPVTIQHHHYCYYYQLFCSYFKLDSNVTNENHPDSWKMKNFLQARCPLYHPTNSINTLGIFCLLQRQTFKSIAMETCVVTAAASFKSQDVRVAVHQSTEGAKHRSRTLLLVLSLKLPSPVISLPSYALSTNSESLNASNTSFYLQSSHNCQTSIPS